MMHSAEMHALNLDGFFGMLLLVVTRQAINLKYLTLSLISYQISHIFKTRAIAFKSDFTMI